MNTTNTSADDLLNHQHRWMRVGWPLAAANIGLFLTLVALWAAHPSLAQLSRWGLMPVWWVSGVAGSFALALLFLLLRRRPVAHSARQLDARLDARNRLETAAALGAAADPISRAQRRETTQFLRRAPVKTRHLHLRLLAAGLGLAIVIHLFTLMMWTRPWQTAAAPVAKTPPPPAVPKGVITWKSPRAETTAVPIEEVPLAAVADSTSGLKDMTLEISVNGEARQSVKVPVEALDKTGQHPVAASIYLDQLNVEPFDMVSYYLRAQRIAPGNLPATASQVQFVEVKPFRDDIQHLPSGGAGGIKPLKELASVTALKLAQLRLVKENFFLTHADLDHGDSVWSSENQRVGSEQNVLDTKTSETVDQMTQDGAPAEVVDLLNQARPFMTGASAKILAKQNDPALPLQGKSLALITAVEKYIHKIIGDAAAAQARSGLKDPFEKKRELEMKQRSATQAGELELLAKEQERLAHDLAQDSQQARQEQQAQPNQPSQGQQNKPGQDDPGAQAAKPDPNRIEGTPVERQTQISQRIGALLNGSTLDPAVTQHLENGRNEAGEALKQLDAGDDVKAQEPAAGAAHELRLAEKEMNKMGEEKARDELSNAVMLLDQAAEQARTAPQQKTNTDAQGNAQKAGDDVTQAKANLADAAKEQQETGSEKEAARLADFAKMLNDDLLRADLQKLHDQPRDKTQAEAVAAKLGAIADQLAMQPGGIGHTPEEIPGLIERAERSKANLERLAAMERAADTDHNQTGSEKAEQQRRSFAGQVFDDIRQETADAQTVLPPNSTMDLRSSLSNSGGLGSGQVTRGFGKIDGPLSSMIALLRAEMLRAQRQYELTDQTMAKAPPAYREAVADYFERLSRDFEKQGAPTAPAPSAASAAPDQSPAP